MAANKRSHFNPGRTPSGTVHAYPTLRGVEV